MRAAGSSRGCRHRGGAASGRDSLGRGDTVTLVRPARVSSGAVPTTRGGPGFAATRSSRSRLSPPVTSPGSPGSWRVPSARRAAACADADPDARAQRGLAGQRDPGALAGATPGPAGARPDGDCVTRVGGGVGSQRSSSTGCACCNRRTCCRTGSATAVSALSTSPRVWVMSYGAATTWCMHSSSALLDGSGAAGSTPPSRRVRRRLGRLWGPARDGGRMAGAAACLAGRLRRAVAGVHARRADAVTVISTDLLERAVGAGRAARPHPLDSDRRQRRPVRAARLGRRAAAGSGFRTRRSSSSTPGLHPSTTGSSPLSSVNVARREPRARLLTTGGASPALDGGRGRCRRGRSAAPARRPAVCGARRRDGVRRRDARAVHAAPAQHGALPEPGRRLPGRGAPGGDEPNRRPRPAGRRGGHRLVVPEDPCALRRRRARACWPLPAQRQEMGTRARALAETSLAWRTHAARLDELYGSWSSTGPRGSSIS